jgi:hypothetical protein
MLPKARSTPSALLSWFSATSKQLCPLFFRAFKQQKVSPFPEPPNLPLIVYIYIYNNILLMISDHARRFHVCSWLEPACWPQVRPVSAHGNVAAHCFRSSKVWECERYERHGAAPGVFQILQVNRRMCERATPLTRGAVACLMRPRGLCVLLTDLPVLSPRFKLFEDSS